MNLTRAEAEDFLYHEAELLDDWRLPEWADLYAEDAVYEITSPSSADPVASDAGTSLFLVSDRIDRIRARASRLMKKTAHAEFPRSKTRHMVSNVRITASNSEGTQIRSNLLVYRTKEDTTSVFMGEVRTTVTREGDALKIHHKRVILDLNSLYNQGRLTIIL